MTDAERVRTSGGQEQQSPADALWKLAMQTYHGDLGPGHFESGVREILEAYARSRVEQQEMGWRKALWLRHGCPLVALYGDDGEMQCSSCTLDFKRHDIETIRNRWEVLAERGLRGGGR